MRKYYLRSRAPYVYLQSLEEGNAVGLDRPREVLTDISALLTAIGESYRRFVMRWIEERKSTHP